MKSPKLAPQTLALFKRFMGQENCGKQIKRNGVMQHVSPVEGSACILHSLLTSANEDQRASRLPEVRKAVITIPAGFTSHQRDCTKAAAQLAGIEVLGLIHEPTAAAISYNIAGGETIMVFDLGGGTLDVSIVHNEAGTYRTLASSSDFDVLNRYVGGQDWDEALIDFACDEMGLNRDKSDYVQEGFLHDAAENCKILLTTNSEAPFTLDMRNTIDVKRSDFERITRHLVSHCIKVVEAALQKCTKRIDRCVLAGGSSNMPMIRQALTRTLGGRIGSGSEQQWFPIGDAENAIANGAARYAYMLETGAAKIEEKSSHSYGTLIGSAGQYSIQNLILSTHPMIYSGKNLFRPRNDKQTAIMVDVYENNSTEEVVPYDAKQHPRLFSKEYRFDHPEKVTTKLSITFAVSRDKDGIISIKVSCEGQHTEDYQISTVVPPINDQVRQQILKSIQLMDKAQ